MLSPISIHTASHITIVNVATGVDACLSSPSTPTYWLLKCSYKHNVLRVSYYEGILSRAHHQHTQISCEYAIGSSYTHKNEVYGGVYRSESVSRSVCWVFPCRDDYSWKGWWIRRIFNTYVYNHKRKLEFEYDCTPPNNGRVMALFDVEFKKMTLSGC